MTKQLEFYFGDQYELKLIKLIIGEKDVTSEFVKRNCKFGVAQARILDTTLFSNRFGKQITEIILEYFQKYKTIPWYDEIKGIIKTTLKVEAQDHLNYLLEIYKTPIGDERKFIQDSAKKFFQQQRLSKATIEIQKIISTGQYERYDECVGILKAAFEDNDIDENHHIVDEISEADLKDKPMDYIPMGWGVGLESYLSEGKGLVKGGIYGIFAPSGAGKTTSSIVTLANAFASGRTVVQIFFEGTLDDIKKMQFAHWSGLNKSAIREQNSQLIIHHSNLKIKGAKSNNGKWIIKKFRANHTKWSEIEAYLDKLIDMGYDIDLLSVDYTECIKSAKNYTSDWGGQHAIVQDIEYYCETNAICGIIYFQGNREGQNSRILLEEHLGGDFKKIQPCHVIFTISKSNNIVILKNRLGEGNRVFTNCLYDKGNIRLIISPENVYGTVTEYQEQFN